LQLAPGGLASAVVALGYPVVLIVYGRPYWPG
jgi:hypothetical protein